MKKIILASKSPRRKQLLEWAEIDFSIHAIDTDETYPASLDFQQAAMHIAKNKARAVAEKLGLDVPILAADTLVICQGQHFAKPDSEADAIRMIGALSGKKHEVITGVCILYRDAEIQFSDTTHVRFHSLSASQIKYYVEKYKPMDKAGAYAIQEWIGVVGIHSVEGDFYNVMGLPVSRVVQALQSLEDLH